MSFAEIVVVVGGVFFGFIIVWAFFEAKDTHSDDKHEKHEKQKDD